MSTDYLEFAKQLAVKAGEIMTTNYRLGMEKTWKDDNTPLTVTDLMINEMVIKHVVEEYPHHGVVAEEKSSSDLQREWVWVCDPIDGTVPFSHGTPAFAFSLALVHNGVVEVAVVFDALSERMFTAVRGEGCYCNGERITVNDGGAVDVPVIDLEDPWQQSPYDWGDIRFAFQQRGLLVQTLWSVVFAASRVANGDLAATICNRGHVWDIAAISLLITEAGGRVTDLSGIPVEMVEPQFGFILSDGEIHDALVEAIQASPRA